MQRNPNLSAIEQTSFIEKGIELYNNGDYQAAHEQLLNAYIDLEQIIDPDCVTLYERVYCRYMLTLCSYYDGQCSHTQAKKELLKHQQDYAQLLEHHPATTRIMKIAQKDKSHLDQQLQQFDHPDEIASSLCNQACYQSRLILERNLQEDKIVSVCHEAIQNLSTAIELAAHSANIQERCHHLLPVFHEALGDHWFDQFNQTNQLDGAMIQLALFHYEAVVQLLIKAKKPVELDLIFSLIHTEELTQQSTTGIENPQKLLSNLLERFNIEEQIQELPGITEQDKKIKEDYTKLFKSHLDYALDLEKRNSSRNQKRGHDEDEQASLFVAQETGNKRRKINETTHVHGTSNPPLSQDLAESSTSSTLTKNAGFFHQPRKQQPLNHLDLAIRPLRKLFESSPERLNTADHCYILCEIADFFLLLLMKNNNNDQWAHALILIYESIEIASHGSTKLDGNLQSAFMYFNENYADLIENMAKLESETTFQRKVRYAKDFKQLGSCQFSLSSLKKFTGRLHNILAEQFIPYYLDMLLHMKDSPIISAIIQKLPHEQARIVQEAFRFSIKECQSAIQHVQRTPAR